MSHKCDCCKEEVHNVDEYGLCVSCDIVQTIAPMLEEAVGLCGDHAVDLACDIGEVVQSIILHRMIDCAMPSPDFLADIGRDMVRVRPDH